MAATRKLQGEIERCLKKVTEGVETFEDIWMKVSHAANSNQKEKYEADLKKEIKKLQRLRDQIKTWQASAEVKDKSSLIDHRKLIETQMERFKGLERETKTKAYSKEGLGAAVKLDPVQKERDDCTRWLSNNIEQLNVQIDQFEAELDGLAAKKKRDRDKAERLESLKHWIERHRYHIKKLETLLRMLDNNAVDTDVVKKIRDDVEYYTESNQEPEFEENEYIYCDINMDNLEEVFINDVGMVDARGDDQSETTNSLHSGSSPSPLNNTGGACSSVSGGGTSAATTPSNSHHQHHSSASSAATAAPSTAASSAGSGDSNHHHNHHHSTADDSKRTRRSISEDSTTQKSKHPSKSSLQSSKTPVGSTSCLSGSSALSSRSQSAPTAAAQSADQTTVPSLSAGAGGAPNFASVAAATSLSAASAHHPVHILTTSCSSASSMSLIASTLSSSAASSSAASAASSGHQHLSSAVQSAGALAHLLHPLPSPAPPTLCPTTSSTPSSVSAAPTVSSASHQHQLANSVSRLLHQVNGDKSLDAMTIKSLTQQTSSADHRNALSVSPVESNKPAATNETHIPTLYSVAPLGPVPITKDHDYQFQMLQAAFYHMPHPSDSERLRTYLPRNPYPTPPYHPQVPPPGSDSFEFFMKLSVETLFFIFYYMEGTKAQYLAAKSLKKQSWRFHTKYMMWFQRHEEPKLITDEFEQGTYIYFDFEKWSQRKKEGFKFEYKFLEDRDLN